MLVLAALVATVQGQPSPETRYGWIAAQADRQIRERAIFVHPAEVVAMRKDTAVRVGILDVRDEHDFNLFHLAGARRVSLGDLRRPGFVKPLLDQPANVVTFVVSNGEGPALAAWKTLRGSGVLNVYVIEGGINRWLELYPPPPCVATPLAGARSGAPGADEPAYRFVFSTGSALPSAQPELPPRLPDLPCPAVAGSGVQSAAWPAHPFETKVKLQLRRAVRGGCG